MDPTIGTRNSSVVFDYDEKADVFSETICPMEPTKVIVARRSWSPIMRRAFDEATWRVAQFIVIGVSIVVAHTAVRMVIWLIGRLV